MISRPYAPSLRRPRLRPSLLLALLSLLAGCAALKPPAEPPTVTLSSFRALPSEGLAPQFEIVLNVLNPNREPLKLEGVVYTVSLEGHELIKGAGSGFPAIEPYAEESITLTARADLLGGVRMLREMMQRPAESLEYRFEARLDLAGLQPSVRVAETGYLGTGPEH
jgi:LEA14-like dessication related protein